MFLINSAPNLDIFVQSVWIWLNVFWICRVLPSTGCNLTITIEFCYWLWRRDIRCHICFCHQPTVAGWITVQSFFFWSQLDRNILLFFCHFIHCHCLQIFPWSLPPPQRKLCFQFACLSDYQQVYTKTTEWILMKQGRMGHEPRENPLNLLTRILITKIFRLLVSRSVYSLDWIQMQIQDLNMFFRGGGCLFLTSVW